MGIFLRREVLPGEIGRAVPGFLNGLMIKVPGQNIFQKNFPGREKFSQKFSENIVRTKKLFRIFPFQKFLQKFSKPKKEIPEKKSRLSYSFLSVIRYSNASSAAFAPSPAAMII
jgi:hypothetical protein